MIYLLLFSIIFCYLPANASKPLTHHDKVSKHLFFIRPKADALTSTQLFKDIEKQVALSPHVSEKTMQEICDTLVLVERARRTHAQFLKLLLKPHKTSSKKAIALIDGYAFDLNDPKFNKEAFLALSKQFETQYPKKFNKCEKLMSATGFDNAQTDLTNHFDDLPQSAPNAFNIIKSALDRNNVHTLGQLLRYAAPISE
jgi:hypothetical protein